MNVGDHIDVALITEQAGVAMTNILYFEVSDATLTTTLEAAILEIATSFNTALGTSRSSSAVLTCGTWTNRDGNDPFAQNFFNIPGAGAAAALPTQSAIRVRRYGLGGGQLRHGAINVAGIVEANVERGRLLGLGELGTIESWLASNLILPAGPTLSHGFWYDTVTPGTPIWVDTLKARTMANIRTLTRRRSKLCGQ